MADDAELIANLESVPANAVLIVDFDEVPAKPMPVGQWCHEAAAELRRLTETNA